MSAKRCLVAANDGLGGAVVSVLSRNGEAGDAASQLAIALAKGDTAGADKLTTGSVMDLCTTAALKKACEANGVGA